MNTKSFFVKAASVAAIILLGVSLSACGKKAEPLKEQYVYDTTYERIPTDEEDMYTSATEVSGDYIYSIVYEYKNESVKYFIKKHNNVDKSDKITELQDDRLKDNAYIDKFHIYDDETVGAIVNIYNEEMMSSDYWYSIYSADGKLIENNKLEFETGGDRYFYVAYTYFAEDKSLIIQSDDKLYKVDKSGKMIKSLQVDTWIRSTEVSPSGKIYVCTFLDSGEAICPVKDDFSGLEDKLDISLNNGRICAITDTSIIVSSDISLKSYNLATKETETIWEWTDLDIDDNYIDSISINDDGTYTIVSEVWSEDFSGIEIARVEKKEAEPGKERSLIVFGCTYIDQPTKKAIKDFNRSSSEYRITIKCYEDEIDDYETILERMGTDITQGKIDVVDLSHGLNYQTLVNSKALACLDDYYAKDVNSNDYFTNIFDAYKVDGKNYCVVPKANIITLGMSKDVTGGKGSVTLEELINIRKSNPDKEFMSYASKEMMFYICCIYSISDYVDFDKGTCSFDSEKFCKILEFANTFPKDEDIEIDYETYDEWALMKSGDIIMTMLYLSDTSSLRLYSQLMKGGLDITGYPVSSGSGHLIDANSQYGIAAKSNVRDGAWEFLKTLLLPENQNSYYYSGFPVLKSAFDDKMKEEMKEEGVSTYGNGFSQVELKQLTKEQADLIRNLYENATNVTQYDEKMIEIIDEETAAYFAGQKSVQDVSKIIQDRVSIYLAESR